MILGQGAELEITDLVDRKDKPVLLYENQRAQRVTNAALYLKKQGFSEIYILSYGLDSWKGKVKVEK